MTSILLDWVQALGLRHQGVIVSAMRGCDVAPRHDPSKLAQRILRASVLLPHAGRFTDPRTYITQEPNRDRWWAAVRPFLRSWDHYPNHYVWHFIHASQVVGYCGPAQHPVHADRWLEFYLLACRRQHVRPESANQMNDRLNADEDAFNAADVLDNLRRE